jgi:flavin reductase (DIM6/NTAB) family NADH-FMN oxidoreductase RutF
MSTAAFKEAMSRFASGVTVVAGVVDGERHGMTVAAFSSVSADPPVVLVCLGKSSRLGASLVDGQPVSVSILPASASASALRFAGLDGHAGDRFEGIAASESSLGVPVLSEATAALVTRVRSTVDVGDHRVLFLDVVEVHVSEATSEPLLWWSRGFAKAVRT